MSEKTYWLPIGRPPQYRGGVSRGIQVTVEDADRIGKRCAEINLEARNKAAMAKIWAAAEAEAAKEAAKPKEYDVGETRSLRNIVICSGIIWRHTAGNIVTKGLEPKTVLFNIKDVLEQGPIVIGMSVNEAKVFISSTAYDLSILISQLRQRVQLALERNK